MFRKVFVFAFGIMVLSSCAIIAPGEVGVKRTLGKLKPKVYQPGVVGVNPFVSRIVRVPTRTVNLEVRLNLPSKEGLNVLSEISILYHINSQKAPELIETVGEDYEDIMILSVFRSAAADVCSRFLAKDMHSGQRAVIEGEIRSHMDSLLADRGFVIESVLLKSISLPPGLYDAIETKLEAEQIAQRMEFELEQERLEAQRKKIEAQGVRDAQQILAEGLSIEIIQWRSLEVLEKLSASPNAKLIITDGQAPVLINPDSE
jgi:regulator of protease activity HflC (stomatin/prohibitin superfamily)